MKRLLCLALMALLLLSGCAQGTDVSAFAPGEEERLVIYTSHKEEVYGPIIKEFQQRTGIWVEVVTGGSGELHGGWGWSAGLRPHVRRRSREPRGL